MPLDLVEQVLGQWKGRVMIGPHPQVIERGQEPGFAHAAVEGELAIHVADTLAGHDGGQSGGFSAATAHCDIARYETPLSPTLPVLQGWPAAHSITSK